jgi:hypothetical protein
VSQVTLNFFLPESRLVRKFAGYVVLLAKCDAFETCVRILGEKGVFNWCFVISLSWIYASRSYPVLGCLGDSMRTPYCY